MTLGLWNRFLAAVRRVLRLERRGTGNHTISRPASSIRPPPLSRGPGRSWLWPRQYPPWLGDHWPVEGPLTPEQGLFVALIQPAILLNDERCRASRLFRFWYWVRSWICWFKSFYRGWTGRVTPFWKQLLESNLVLDRAKEYERVIGCLRQDQVQCVETIIHSGRSAAKHLAGFLRCLRLALRWLIILGKVSLNRLACSLVRFRLNLSAIRLSKEGNSCPESDATKPGMSSVENEIARGENQG